MHVLIYILATWRLSSLLAREAGPWRIFERLRDRAGVGYDDTGQPYGITMLAEGLCCLWCNSVWVGAAWVICDRLIPDIAPYLALPLALSAGAVLIDEVVGWLTGNS